jgi:hypothetical protein
MLPVSVGYLFLASALFFVLPIPLFIHSTFFALSALYSHCSYSSADARTTFHVPRSTMRVDFYFDEGRVRADSVPFSAPFQPSLYSLLFVFVQY